MRSWPRAAKERGRVAEKLLRVEWYAGYKGDERPVKLQIDERMVEITEIEDRWYSPGATF